MRVQFKMAAGAKQSKMNAGTEFGTLAHGMVPSIVSVVFPVPLL